MTMSGTPRHPDWRTGVTWDDLRREPSYRTSEPTYEAVKERRSEVGRERRGPLPFYDTVIYAALRLAKKDLAALAAECDRIEAERHEGRVAPSKLAAY